MTGARVLRAIAIAIAVASVADPALTRDAVSRQPVAVVIVDTEGASSGQRLRTLLDDEYDVTAYSPVASSRAAACPQHGGCIVVSDGLLPPRLTAGATVIGGVRLSQGADVAITRVAVPSAIHLAATSALHVWLQGSASRVEVFDGSILVGATDVTAAVEGTGVGPAPRTGPGPSPRRGLDLSVPWVPIEAGARRLTIRAGGAEAHVGVTISDIAVPVLFYEPEATWLGTFVRRALESDPRFNVLGRTRLAPTVSVTRGAAGPLTQDVLRDIGVVVVTAPDLLTPPEVTLLERFVRARGGSVVVVSDRRPAGSATRLMAEVSGERREDAPAVVGTLRATELVTFNTDAAGVSVLESADGRAVVVSRAIGRGRVITSGALDAWRYRDAGFTGFWTSLVADAAFAAGTTLALTIDPPVLAPGGEGTVTAEWRTLEELPAEVTAEALLTCGERQSVVRLWPGARPGLFSGVTRPEGEGTCELEAVLRGTGPSSSVAAVRNTRSVKLEPAAWPAPADSAQFEAAIAAHGGLTVTSGDEHAIAARVRERLPPRRHPHESRPMHSPWWLLPFAACLGGEWWLRRRAGLR